jgi:hypothetical protein
MKIRFVPRSTVKITKKGSSKFKPLLEALEKLTPGGQALEVNFESDKELNSMRNVVYNYNREHGINIRSGKDTANDRIYFYLDISA